MLTQLCLAADDFRLLDEGTFFFYWWSHLSALPFFGDNE